MLVFMSAWQLQCCGEPFARGADVEWTLKGTDVEWMTRFLGDDLGRQVTHEEDHHGGDLPPGSPTTTGRVSRIRAVSSSFRPDPAAGPEGGIVPVAGSRLVVDVHDAERYPPEGGDRQFVGYLVDLETTATTANPAATANTKE